MITLKFPALEKALTKDVKELNDNDPRRGVIVIESTAIVFHDLYCLMVNLPSYFEDECGLEDEDSAEEMEQILNYFDCKVINKDFWKELTKGANMSIKEGNLLIENPKFSKDLIYKDFNFDLIEPLRKIIDNFNIKKQHIDCISLPMIAIKMIYDVMASNMKSDHIVLEFNDLDEPVRFTFKKRSYVYGYIMPDFNSTQNYDFFDWSGFNDGIIGYLEGLEDEAKVEVPPPPQVEETEEV